MSKLLFTLFIFLNVHLLVYSDHIPIIFNHLYSTDGLSNNTVRTIAQDINGYIWLGTNEGLNRYDGVNFTIYKNDPNNPESLSSNQILALFIDSRGYLWIATDNGLNRWDPQTDRITRFMFDEIDSDKPGANFILNIFEDSLGRIWIGAVNGLRAYSYETDSFESFFHDPNDTTTLSLSHINDVFEDHKGTIWIATHSKGMNRLNDDGKTFTRIMPEQDDMTPSIPWTPTCILEDSKNRFWVGTWDKGLLRFNPDDFAFEPVDEIKNCNVRLIQEDSFGNLWIGTLNAGLYYYDSSTERFSLYKNDPTVESSLSSNRIYSFLQDNNGLLWVGVESGGINTFRHPMTQIQRYQPSAFSKSSLSDKSVMSLLEDSQGIVWIGTHEKGLDRYDPETGEYKNYIYATEDNKPHIDTVVTNYVYSLFELDNGNLLIGTLGYGLLLFDPATATFTSFYDEERIPYIGYFQSIKDIIRDKQGQFWVCNDTGHVICLDSNFQIKRVYGDEPNKFSYSRLTVLEFKDDKHLWVGAEAEGLNLLNTETGEIGYYSHTSKDPNSILDDTIWDIITDHQGRIWIGSNKGLNLYNPATDEFQDIEALHAFPSRAILGIVEDITGKLWLSTNRGLIRYNPQDNSTNWYDLHNGIQGYEYVPKSRYAGRNGKIYFGGQYGFNIIDADAFKNYQSNSPVVLNQINVKGQSYISGQPIWKIDYIELPYAQNNLDLQFSLLDYVAPSLNRLEYRINQSNDWQKMNKSQQILFADLSPGERTLQVRGTNADGYQSQQVKELTISVLPPFWLTWWFQSIIGLAIIALVIILYKFRVRQVKKHNQELQEKVNEQIAQLKILDGLLPICSYCKKVRDDHGYWSQVEAYIQERSQAKFSHGICPECIKKHFPQYSDKIE